MVERLGLPGFGDHNDPSEYVLIDSIPRRLYLASRMIMDFSLEKSQRGRARVSLVPDGWATFIV